jgi:hypothetical protein
LAWCRAAPDPHAAKKRRLAAAAGGGGSAGGGGGVDEEAESGAVAGGHGILCGEAATATAAERRKLMEVRGRFGWFGTSEAKRAHDDAGRNS